MDNSGSVRVTISEDSAQAVLRLPDMQGWAVNPTMVRGSGKKSASLMSGEQKATHELGKGGRGKRKRSHLGRAKKAKHASDGGKRKKKLKGKKKGEVEKECAKGDEKKRKRKKKTKPVLVSLSVEPPTFKDYRRTNKGYALIRGQVSELIELDHKAFQNAPAFSNDGLCRLKLAPAEGKTKEQIIHECHEAVDALILGHASTFFTGFKRSSLEMLSGTRPFYKLQENNLLVPFHYKMTHNNLLPVW